MASPDAPSSSDSIPVPGTVPDTSPSEPSLPPADTSQVSGDWSEPPDADEHAYRELDL